ncbi:MAG TPA: glycosyltransferase [Candidatus Limnocylindrales bacterium]|nr:glycosyltransferase [Candidatus Limnocylindrales bacterium]
MSPGSDQRSRAGSGPLPVVFVIASMITGGTQTHLLQVFRNLDRSRFRPFLFVLRDDGNLLGEARAAGVETRTFGMSGSLRSPRDLLGLYRIAKALRRIGPAVVHGYLLRGNFYAAAAGRLARVPVVVTSKRGLHKPAGRAERVAVAISGRCSDAITGNSRQVLEFTRDIEGSFPAPMVMIPSGIDTDRFDPDQLAADAAASLRAELGIAGAPVVGTAITFRPRKGFRMLFEAMAEVRRSIPDAQLLIAGASEMPPEPAALADSLGLAGSIHLLGRRSDMPQVLAAMDVFVLPSESEGMSNAILEAMSMKLPVVVTSVGGAPEVITEGVDGFLVDYPDSHAMAVKVARLLGSGDLRRRTGSAARERVVAAYSAAGMVRQIENLYVNLRSGKKP